MAPSSDFHAFQTALRNARNIIAVAGAGLSAASGIPTFRGAGGMWRKYDAMSLATPEAFERSPILVWQFYHYRRETASHARPNDAHRALSAFSRSALRKQVAPHSNFTLITQNVDGLSVRANQELAAVQPDPNDQPSLIEMHGRLFDVLCNNPTCGHVEFNTNSPVCEALGGTEKLVEQHVVDPDVQEKDLPHCSKCGGLARPGVVWFGEQPHQLDEIDDLVAEADLCLVVGTSSTVYPAASYAEEVEQNGGKVAVFNLERSHGDNQAHFLFLGPCEETLPKALGFRVAEDGSVAVDVGVTDAT
ncbi:hypothetical protein NLJ89_g9959 [Agrocybe chaxingu]|uniref:NAD-dependent protein deacylase n=1 Tax=Agrocybe chaxingu TaxID=84603 RepID=A0A9W8JS27_9AGAR|nr:hypothetical protein NLJ89_g9959 [Agrocybe chaxingu]